MNEPSLSARPSAADVRSGASAAMMRRARHFHPLLPLLVRMHFYVGLLVGPFLLVAAASGVLYALTPQIEDLAYRHALYASGKGAPMPLADQIGAAVRVAGPDERPIAVRPAPAPGETTRVMFGGPDMGPSESRAVFIDPATGQIQGQYGVYGTSGVLPIRSWIDQFHRGLHLGDVGRLYSELAASWLWILALGGLLLWVTKRRGRRSSNGGPAGQPGRTHSLRRWHSTLGLWALAGIVFFSVTGLTWSQYAGKNISVLRSYYGWGTPSVSTALNAADSSRADEHAHHHGMPRPAGGVVQPAEFDAVLRAARAAGIDAAKVEIRPPAKAGTAWTVTEIDRSWPTQVDAAAVDPRTMTVIDQTRFAEFPLAAKLTRWGIDAHMGALFGLANQLVLILFASGLLIMVVWGYLMWWRRRPTNVEVRGPSVSWITLLRRVPAQTSVMILGAAAVLGWFLPLLGISLAGFLLLDLVVTARARRARLKA